MLKAFGLIQPQNIENITKLRKQLERLITNAARDGAAYMVTPELSLIGYIPNQDIWRYAEYRDGESVRWVCELAKRLQVHIGAGFLETDGSDYYNAYLIANPDGAVDGIVHKKFGEADCFKRAQNEIEINTAFGRIGVAICVDNHYADTLQRVGAAGVDLMLMPHANPTPYTVGNFFNETDILRFEDQPRELASLYARSLGVPVIYVNFVGNFQSMRDSFTAKSMNNCRLRGGSLAVGASGILLQSKLPEEAAYAVVDIEIGGGKKPFVMPKIYHGDWLHSGSWLYRKVIMPLDIRKGVRMYKEAKSLLNKSR